MGNNQLTYCLGRLPCTEVHLRRCPGLVDLGRPVRLLQDEGAALGRIGHGAAAAVAEVLVGLGK